MTINALPPSRKSAMFLGLALLLTALLPASLRAATDVHDAREVRLVQIGFAGPLSGSSAQMGQSQAHAVELALAEINSRGVTAGGRPLLFKLLTQDDRGDIHTATLVANYLVKSEVVAVIGHWNTAASMRAAPIYHAAGIAQIAPGSTGRQYTQNAYADSFRIVGHDDDGGRYASGFALQQLKARRVAVIHDETGFGTMLANQFMQGLQDKGGVLVAQQAISSKTSDFNAALTEVRNKDADLIFFGGLGPQAAALKLAMRRTGVNATLLAADGIVSPTFLRLTGVDGEGTFGIAPGQAQEKMAGWKKFQDKYVAAYGGPIELFAPFAYDAAYAIVAAIQQADSLEPARIAAALHNLRYKGLTGTIAFDAEGNLLNPAYTIYQVRSGKWIPVQVFGGK
jgi:branched-chain amino acid transport system substrate-binding protein